MKQTYQLTGMTCSSCEAKVKSSLLNVEGVREVEVSKNENSAIINMERQVKVSELQKSLDSKYHISEIFSATEIEESQSWFETYKPILLIFGYITLISFLIQLKNDSFNWMEAMRHFMAGFFLVFSFFKFLNIKGFADSYAMYDIVAKKLPVWGYFYVFIELGLGLAFLTDFNPLVTNWLTLVIMTVSIIGVLQSVINKKVIQCACLGTVFNLPMSTVTIIEDLLMIVMSITMLMNMY